MREPLPILETLRARWLLLLVALVVGGVVGIVVDRFMPAEYTATANAIVVPLERGGSDASVDAEVNLAQAYARLADDPQVVGDAARALKLRVPTQEVTSVVRATASPDAPIIEIFVTRESAVEAARLANALVASLASYSRDSGSNLGYLIRPFTVATVPPGRSDPGPLLAGALGGALGLLVGGMLALVLPRMRSPLRVTHG